MLRVRVVICLLVLFVVSFPCCRATVPLLASPSTPACKCANPSHCSLPPHTNLTRSEIFAFIPFTMPRSIWETIEKFGLVTTFVLFAWPAHFDEKYFWDEVLCPAHARGIRVSTLVSYPVAQLGNISKREEFKKGALNMWARYRIDGVNFDTESPIQDPTVAKQYTSLVAETRAVLRGAYPLSQTTVDVAWSPDCIDLRCYDYAGLAAESDFVFVMAYDMRSQVKTGPCIAYANDALPDIEKGLSQYLKIASRDKLVLGSPWYGYVYPCLAATKEETCPIRHVPFRGVSCSDAAGGELGYGGIVRLIEHNMTDKHPHYDVPSRSYFFNYNDARTGQRHQVWYDTPETLSDRYLLARKLGLRGVGMWQASEIDYGVEKQVKAMWEALKVFLLGD